MNQFRITVKNRAMLERVYAAGALGMIAPEQWALSACRWESEGNAWPDLPFGVLLNRPVSQPELTEIASTLESLKYTPVQVIAFSDPAFLELTPDPLVSKLVYRPETLVTNARDAAFWLDQKIGGISVSPLLTEAEVTAILPKIRDAELSIHGHVLLSVSRRRLLSAWKDFANADENLSDREDLTLRETTRSEHMPVIERSFGTMIFSDYVQESFDEITLFAHSGAEAFFIESAWLTDAELMRALELYQVLLNGRNGEEEIRRYREDFPDCAKGYYEQKTVL